MAKKKEEVPVEGELFVDAEVGPEVEEPEVQQGPPVEGVDTTGVVGTPVEETPEDYKKRKAFENKGKSKETVDEMFVPPKGPASIRDLDLEPSQKDLLLKSGMRDIFAKQRAMQGGQIPAVVAEDGSEIQTVMGYSNYNGGPTIFALINEDYRKVQDAWDFYKLHADSPSQKGFIDLLRETSPKEQRVLSRMVPLNLK